jgi:hypothetical protein
LLNLGHEVLNWTGVGGHLEIEVFTELQQSAANFGFLALVHLQVEGVDADGSVTPQLGMAIGAVGTRGKGLNH